MSRRPRSPFRVRKLTVSALLASLVQHPCPSRRVRLDLEPSRLHDLRRDRLHLGLLCVPLRFPLHEPTSLTHLLLADGAFAVCIYPIWEYRESLATIFGHIWADLTGKGK